MPVQHLLRKKSRLQEQSPLKYIHPLSVVHHYKLFDLRMSSKAKIPFSPIKQPMYFLRRARRLALTFVSSSGPQAWTHAGLGPKRTRHCSLKDNQISTAVTVVCRSELDLRHRQLATCMLVEQGQPFSTGFMQRIRTAHLSLGMPPLKQKQRYWASTMTI